MLNANWGSYKSLFSSLRCDPTQVDALPTVLFRLVVETDESSPKLILRYFTVAARFNMHISVDSTMELAHDVKAHILATK